MQLQSLEIYGFKSFAERTKFVFDAGITGVVGPNGCGKSNVVDSIRWVLGEQRTRNLRSDKMENVIFNGTAHRRKANFAEVSLTFENTKNILPTEYTTITITRKLYRTGESEYLINDVQCRLKDIQNLFMDTGIASDSYAIIELKMVDEMLTNKDNERRRFFEEAAGISKYKIRKKQTLKQLEETEADLSRVEDILFEIEKNLKSLEKQAKRTQKYFELKAEYKQVSADFAQLKLRDIARQEAALQTQAAQLEDEFVAARSEGAQRESRILELKKELVDAEQALSAAQRDLNAHLRNIQEIESQKSIKNERLKYLQQREFSINNQSETERRQLDSLTAQSESLRKQEAETTLQVELQQAKKGELETAVEQLKAKSSELERVAAEMAAEHRALESEVQRLRQEREIKSVQVRSLAAELQRAEADREERTESLDEFAAQRESLTAQVESLQKQVAELRTLQAEHESALKATESQHAEAKESLYKIVRMLDARTNEYALTKSLVESLEGFPESVKFLKKNAKNIQYAPLLSDVFAVPEAYKIAFESYLEPYLSYFVVNTRQEAVEAIQLLSNSSKGRANFFILSEIKNLPAMAAPATQNVLSALDVVQVTDDYRPLAAFLLGNILIVPQDSDIPEEIPENEVFLSASGGFSRRKCVVSGGSLGLFEGKRLGRAKNLEALDAEVKSLTRQRLEAQGFLTDVEAKLAELRKQNFATQLAPLERQLITSERDLQLLQTREREHREFIERVGARADALYREQTNLQIALTNIEPELAISNEELLRMTGKLGEARSAAAEAMGIYTAQSQAFNAENIRLIQLQNQADSLRRDLENRATQIATLTANAEKLRAERTQTSADIDAIIDSTHRDDDAIVDLYEHKRALEARTDRAEQLVAQLKSGILQQETALSAVRQRQSDISSRQSALKDRQAEAKIQGNSLRERMSVEFGIEIAAPSPMALAETEPQEPVSVLELRMLKLREQVHAFGEINPMAMEAYTEMKERYDFITAQKNDLLTAKTSLLDTIAEIDADAQEKFMATFVLVREHFQRVFRSLFSQDDTCDLLLVNPENPLESEIEIQARPKGKRPLTIAQLSGGEKTLTAVALLFSIYLIKPAPFCIFDEVDAPLDDANIDKFNNIIRDFSRDSQFIIVTHNKRTMATTNVMYGVTMEAEGANAGVSRVLPVNLEVLNLR